MRVGIFEGVVGRRCTFTREVVHTPNLRAVFSGILDRMKVSFGSRPSFSSFRRSQRVTPIVKLVTQEGVIEKENARTVWIRFGGAGQGIAKVKKGKVQL